MPLQDCASALAELDVLNNFAERALNLDYCKPELRDESALTAELARWESLRFSATLDRIDADLVLGRHEALVGELDALAASHPLDERVRGQLMLALYRAGRQADALRVFSETRQTLAEELGIEPGGDLQQLEYYTQQALQDPRDVMYWAEYDRDTDEQLRDFNEPFT